MKEMIEFILFVFISSLVCNGWYIATRIGMVFGFWEKFWEQFTQISDEYPANFLFAEWVRKPISSCIICYASIYGIIIFIVTMAFSRELNFDGFKTVLIWIAYTLSLAFSNNFLHNKLIQK